MLLKKEKPSLALIAVFAALTFIACSKDEKPAPVAEMVFINLQDKAVKHNEPATLIDLNQDGTIDIIFGTMAVGDPVNQLDKWQYRIGSGIETRLAVNTQEQVPMMNKGQRIPVQGLDGYTWYEASGIVLMQKNISDKLPVFWSGIWMNANRRYIPVQVKKAGKKYNGWIELSTDITQEKIILHKAAITKEPEKDALAGN
jgi:hypothetical protein